MSPATPVGNRISQWGEGPVWHENKLTHVDIKGKAVVSFDPSTGEESVIQLDQQVGFCVPCLSGRWLFGGDRGLFFLDPSSGFPTLITDPESDLEDNRFNDGKVAPDGRLLAGTIAQKKVPGTAKLYRLNSDLSCQIAYQPVTNSNGLAWSADGQTLYYIDTPSKEVKAFDYCQESGELTHPRSVIDTAAIDASPDGMCIDSEDKLWIAFCHGGCVIRFDPEDGGEIQRISVPALETTSCCFGGPERRSLYITTGIHATKEEALGGRLFVVEDCGVSGPPCTPFNDAAAS